MAGSKAKTQVGYIDSDGRVVELGYADSLPDLGSYHTNAQYAEIRAKVLGTRAVRRTVTTTTSEWEVQ